MKNVFLALTNPQSVDIIGFLILYTMIFVGYFGKEILHYFKKLGPYLKQFMVTIYLDILSFKGKGTRTQWWTIIIGIVVYVIAAILIIIYINQKAIITIPIAIWLFLIMLSSFMLYELGETQSMFIFIVIGILLLAIFISTLLYPWILWVYLVSFFVGLLLRRKKV